MNKLKISIVLLLSIAICFGGSCVNLYQETQTTGEILVKGVIDDYFYQDNGEVMTNGYFESRVTQKENDEYDVSGDYDIKVYVGIQDAHLCLQIYSSDVQKSEQYSFTGTRESSRVGQNYSAKEVTPDLTQIVKDLLHQLMVQAIQQNKRPYIINLLNYLTINYKPKNQEQKQQY